MEITKAHIQAARNPSTAPSYLWELVPWLPEEVAENPVLPLLFMEEPYRLQWFQRVCRVQSVLERMLPVYNRQFAHYFAGTHVLMELHWHAWQISASELPLKVLSLRYGYGCLGDWLVQPWYMGTPYSFVVHSTGALTLRGIPLTVRDTAQALWREESFQGEKHRECIGRVEGLLREEGVRWVR